MAQMIYFEKPQLIKTSDKDIRTFAKYLKSHCAPYQTQQTSASSVTTRRNFTQGLRLPGSQKKIKNPQNIKNANKIRLFFFPSTSHRLAVHKTTHTRKNKREEKKEDKTNFALIYSLHFWRISNRWVWVEWDGLHRHIKCEDLQLQTLKPPIHLSACGTNCVGAGFSKSHQADNMAALIVYHRVAEWETLWPWWLFPIA